jgi:repressor LexA
MLWSGEDLTGRFSSATNSALVLTLTGTIGSPRTIDRANIRRVVRIRRPSLPDPGKWMIVGAVAGGAIGATSGAIRDANHHQNNGGWFIGGLSGARLGFLGSCAALAGVGTVALFRYNIVVYQDASKRAARCLSLVSFLLDIRFLFAHNRLMAITRRQREVYDFISRFVAENNYSPSYEEIRIGLGLNSLATVHKHISNLEKKALLTRDYNRSRSIDLLPPKGKLKQSMSVNTSVVLPLLGRIAAGRPIEAVQNPETISLADFVRSKEVFVLEVRGDSMQDEAILDGDYVLVEKSKTAHNGDIVVALVDTTDATLKRFYREGDKIRLQPSNSTMKPIIVPASTVEVQGRVIGVLRKY